MLICSICSIYATDQLMVWFVWCRRIRWPVPAACVLLTVGRKGFGRNGAEIVVDHRWEDLIAAPIAWATRPAMSLNSVLAGTGRPSTNPARGQSSVLYCRVLCCILYLLIVFRNLKELWAPKYGRIPWYTGTCTETWRWPVKARQLQQQPVPQNPVTKAGNQPHSASN